jgi:hypothetical protein
MALSIATRASTAGRRRQRAASVRGSAVTRNPRMETISPDGISNRHTSSPARDRRPERGGATISTVLVGSTSSPNNQAAVVPAKTISSGSKRRQAESVSNGSSFCSAHR